MNENPSLIERLLDALNITGTAATASSVILTLGLILMCGFLMTRLTKLLKLPNVTAYIVAGILIGPNVINLIPGEFIVKTDFLSDIAVAFVAFCAGEYFKISDIKKAGLKVIVIAAMEAVLTIILVFLVCFAALGLSVAFSAVLAATAGATASTATIMIIKQTKAKGDYVNSILEVVALDNVITLILFSIVIPIFIAVDNGGVIGFEQIGLPLIYNLICIVIGGLFGFVLRFLITTKRTTDNRLINVCAILLLFCGICALMGQSPLLGCMAIGAVYTNIPKNEEKLFAQVNYFIPPIMLIFFVRSGMNFNFSTFVSTSSVTPLPLFVVAIVYVLTRITGQYSGAFLGGLISRAEPSTRNFLGFSLIPQASVAIPLAAMGARTLAGAGYPEEAAALTTIVVASAIICELIGPALSKLGLYLSHSYDAKDSLPGAKVETVPQVAAPQEDVHPDIANEDAFNEAAENCNDLHS